MTVIQIHIPDDLEPALQQVLGDVEDFILSAVRNIDSTNQVASL